MYTVNILESPCVKGNPCENGGTCFASKLDDQHYRCSCERLLW